MERGKDFEDKKIYGGENNKGEGFYGGGGKKSDSSEKKNQASKKKKKRSPKIYRVSRKKSRRAVNLRSALN